MSRRADCTLILVTDKIVVRSDFAGASMAAAGESVRLERNVDSGLFEDIRRVIENQPMPGRRVAVLATSVWNQLVSIPRMSIESVDTEQLADALKYEVEPLVGIDAESAALGFAEISSDIGHDQRQFWVNVAPHVQWDAIRKLLLSRKAREICLAHPVAVSSFANSGTQTEGHANKVEPANRKGPVQARKRIEFWDNTVFLVSGDGRLEKSSMVTAGSIRWLKELGFDNVDDAIGQSTVLVAPEQQVAVELSTAEGLDNGLDLNDLNNQERLDQWLQRISRGLAANSFDSFPVIREVRKSKGTSRQWLMKAAALTLVVIFCGWHLSWLKGHNLNIVQQTAALKVPGVEKQKYDAMLQSLLEKRDTITKESILAKVELQKVRFFFENQTDRTHTLLSKLVELRINELVFKEISVNEKGTLVAGISLDSDAAPLLTNRLRDAVSTVGWKIHPASQQGQLKMTNGGPWTFSILLEDVGPPGLLRETRGGVAGLETNRKIRVRP